MDLTINLLTNNFIFEKKVTKKKITSFFFENLILMPYICGSKFILKKLSIWLLMKKWYCMFIKGLIKNIKKIKCQYLENIRFIF